MQALFGGSSGSQQSSSASGYSALPSQLQTPFNALGTQVGALTNPSNPGVTQMFTPSAMTPGENTAAANINAGFAPTASSINTDMNMQMNPYMSSVIGGVDQNAQAADSVFNQSLANAGVGPDSNTSILGANNIQQIVAQNAYITAGSSQCTLILPLTGAVGDSFIVTGLSSLFQITQNANQSIIFGMLTTTAGAGGSITSTGVGDHVTVVCVVANLTFKIIDSMANLTVV